MSALIQFSVTNYRSFHETAVLSMVAPAGTTEGTLRVPGNPSLHLLRVAALFGANASGKSNMLRALGALTALAQGHPLDAVVDPFRLTQEGAIAPTEFQWDGVVGEAQVSYVLVCTAREIQSEALYAVDSSGGETTVFEREPGSTDPLRLGAHMGAEGSVQRQFLSLNAQGTPRDQLLLRDLVLRSRDTPHRVALLDGLFDAFAKDVLFMTPSTAYDPFAKPEAEAARLRAVGDLLARYDTGIDALTVRPVEGVVPPEWRGSDPRLLALKQDFALKGIYLRDRGDPDAAPEVIELLADHRGADGRVAPLRFVDESDGTRRLLHMLPVLQLAVRGIRVLIDELDQSLHAAVAQQFLRDFLALRTDDQLLFTTHDSTILDVAELPSAAVWFVEKGLSGGSRLHSLAEVKSEQLERLTGQRAAAYLQGRFGGLPHIVSGRASGA